jgi:hypothetical protein
MANGDGPTFSCSGCANFRGEGADPTKKLVHLREPGAKFFCLLHKVILPYQQTDGYLICREWKHARTRAALGVTLREKHDGDTLYVYESEYAPAWKVFARFADLPVMPGLEGNH